MLKHFFWSFSRTICKIGRAAAEAGLTLAGGPALSTAQVQFLPCDPRLVGAVTSPVSRHLSNVGHYCHHHIVTKYRNQFLESYRGL